VDDSNPWLGLASFTEETRAYFFGRDEEVTELARRVQRKLLTLLFGQSGLGKTSILRAGLVPRLRGERYCPIYVRIDYGREALEVKFDEDESAAGRFDFARSDYRVLIALREDYLAPLEGLKKDIPSITQNRLRLAPMTGTQALAAVLQPGRKLVAEEVAAAIVRFVAGGAELANAEVEPSLRSLLCPELT